MSLKKIGYITFDGADGVGKSTALELIKNKLIALGTPVHHTRALGGDGTDEFQQSIRKVLLNKKFPVDMPMVFEEQLFSVSDTEGVKEAINFLESKSDGVVLKDRSIASHIVYSMARGMSLDEISSVHGKLFATEKSIDNEYGALHLVFVPNDIGFTMERINARAKATGTEVVERLENPAFQKKVANLMMEFGANPLANGFNIRVIVVKKEDSIENVHDKVKEILSAEGVDL